MVKVVFNEQESTSGARPDDNGFVKWAVDLAPGGRRKIVLRYAVKKKKSVDG